jgi:Ca2+-binding RTX toxin-like protein
LAGANQQLWLSAADVLRFTDSGILRVSGADGNVIEATDDEGWVQGASADGFTTFTNGAATVLVADNLLEDEDQGATLSGTEGNDSTSLGAGSDSYLGLGGDDSVLGNDGDDTIDGGAGGDTIYGGLGDDSILGGEGNDYFVGSSGADTFVGGNGIDSVNYSFNPSNNSAATQGVSIDLAAGTGRDGYDSAEILQSIEIIYGTSFADTISGGTASETFNGNGGADVLDGGAGNDLLIGDGLGGSLSGGAGDDVILVGGVTLAEIYALFGP